MEEKGTSAPNDSGQNRPAPELPAPDSQPSRAENIVSRKVADETILVPIKSTAGELDDIFTLNDVGSRTWELIDGVRTVTEIAAAIASEYDVAPDAALSDTQELISQFMEADIVLFSSQEPRKGATEPG